MNVPRAELLAKIASWYYEHGDGLSVIGKRIGKSISMVSRMLQEARDLGLVEIRINYPLSTVSDLERRLEEKFDVERAYVFAEPTSSTGLDRLSRFGVLSAAAISDELVAASLIGVSWGSHVYSTAKAVSAASSKEGLVVQCSGAIGALEPAYDGARIAEHLAVTLGYKARMLHSPLILDTAAVAEVLNDAKSIREVIDLSKRADVLLLGVGNPFDESSGLRRAGYLTTEDLIALRDNNAVGDILGFHLDKDGSVLDIDLNRRIVGLQPAALKSIPNVMVTATGLSKVGAIQAVLRGGYVTTLLTDESTAEGVLA